MCRQNPSRKVFHAVAEFRTANLFLQDLDLPGPGCQMVSLRSGCGVATSRGSNCGRQPDWKVLGHDGNGYSNNNLLPWKKNSFFHSISTVTFKHLHKKSVSKLVFLVPYHLSLFVELLKRKIQVFLPKKCVCNTLLGTKKKHIPPFTGSWENYRLRKCRLRDGICFFFPLEAKISSNKNVS